MNRQRLVDALVTDEGLELKPYADTVGKLTIGVGRNLTDVGISEREAFYLLDNDIEAVLADLRTLPYFGALDSVRQSVLANLRFNMGPARFRGFRRMLAAVSVNDFGRAAAELKDSAWESQVQRSRSQRLIAELETGEEETS